MAERLSSINDPFKLVDACNRCVKPPGLRKSGIQDSTTEDFQTKLQQAIEHIEREIKIKASQAKLEQNQEEVQSTPTAPETTPNASTRKLNIQIAPASTALVRRVTPARESLDQCLNGLEGLSKMGSA